MPEWIVDTLAVFGGIVAVGIVAAFIVMVVFVILMRGFNA